MKHFSARVVPGAHRIAVGGGPFNQMVAFQNPDGSRVLILSNNTDHNVSSTLNADGTLVRLEIPAQSMNTVTLR
jgi:glucosylceramidase